MVYESHPGRIEPSHQAWTICRYDNPGNTGVFDNVRTPMLTNKPLSKPRRSLNTGSSSSTITLLSPPPSFRPRAQSLRSKSAKTPSRTPSVMAGEEEEKNNRTAGSLLQCLWEKLAHLTPLPSF